MDLLNSFLLVFVGEIGDKTQLLTIMLYQKYKKPWVILAGIFIATILNHLASAWLGSFAGELVDPQILRYALSFIFFAFAVWLLFPDKSDDIKSQPSKNILLTTIVLFFLAEIGDKTQLATVALGARYPNLFIVTIGTTLGMIAANGLALIVGDKLLKVLPMRWVRFIAALIFFAFGITILINK